MGKDKDFSKMHSNKRFKGVKSPKGLDPNLLYQQVCSCKRNNNYRRYTSMEEKVILIILYTLHDDLDETKKFFDRTVYCCDNDDIDLLIERWMRSSYYYFVDPKNKEYLIRIYTKIKLKSGIQ